MILVDINVPSVDKTWDFMIDEDVAVSSLIPELVRMAAKKTGSDSDTDPQGFGLYSATDERELEGDHTLAENGVRDGHRLILI